MENYYEYSVAELVRMLGKRFKEYRMRANMTQKEVAESTGISTATVYKFESGTSTNVSLGTFLLLLKSIGWIDELEHLLPELPESPYLYGKNNKKAQRIRHKKQ